MDDLAALARGEDWTEERHAAFLDRMELSFVRQALAGSDVRQASRRLGRRPVATQTEGGGRGQLAPAPAPLPLDRPLPDSAVESNRSGPRRRAASDARQPVDPAAAGFSRNY
ncbi:hypothetical protein C2845_PM11G30390 [Panicum miliaceum]|uniref:Uncharacterized protein n=1 Tax=Panicum miliaceum TaxID=4540 RepID=A0A3L6RMT4_PANMI|nr:hypothetical protein C2845_PM11G30390 [Panicum miliaceum]